MYQFPADELQLFLAKTAGGAWLKSKDLLRMRKGEIPNDVESRYMNEELEDPTDKISTILSSEIPEGSIHVLVVVPVDPTTVMLKQRRRWIISAQWYLPFVLVGLVLFALAVGENPFDEKGCLASAGRSVVCVVPFIAIAIAAVLKFVLPSWKAHYDGVIEIIERRYHVYDERTPLTRGLR
ncbi:hypothetical protein JG687_00005848 [Phytophthora cactorum]|uniref:Crinkler effector protein N-terminal domain-containing protein n=1 Tax=Phytophthora cactorum TaxID=29920 RepID=A0A8T1UMP6_9STRA|nr:hypothetical protein JG687_00005848 [Phytophthora cactorum]